MHLRQMRSKRIIRVASSWALVDAEKLVSQSQNHEAVDAYPSVAAAPL